MLSDIKELVEYPLRHPEVNLPPPDLNLVTFLGSRSIGMTYKGTLTWCLLDGHDVKAVDFPIDPFVTLASDIMTWQQLHASP